MAARLALPLIAAAALVLGGCSSQDGYPSLARRPVERLSTAPPAPPPAPAPVPPSAETLARLDAALDQTARADASFRDHEPAARRLIGAAAGAPVASEAWSVATVALADLESARSDAMIALADVDALYARARIDGIDTARIEEVRGRIITAIGAQDSVLAALASQLAS